MSEQYEPELGQMLFGQPFKEYKVPKIWKAALVALYEELDRVMGNITQTNYSNPFENTGNSFSCDTFEVHAYSWVDDEQPYNFKWKDVEIGWYKYLGRGMSANQDLIPDLAAEMLTECLAACREYEKEHGKTF